MKPRQFNIPKVPKRVEVTPWGQGQRRPRVKDSLHLEAVAGLPSVISGRTPCQACHIRYTDPRYDKRKTGMGEKPDDCWTLPMTEDEHRLQHSGNEEMFWYVQGINPFAVAIELHEAWACTTDKFAAKMNMLAIIDRLPRWS